MSKTFRNGSTLRVIRLSTIQLDHEGYQREKYEPHVARLAHSIQETGGVGMPRIRVNRRANGLAYCFDGQHTMHALLKLGYSKAEVEYYEGLTQKQEAQQFYALNTIKRGMSGWQSFRAALMSGLPVETRIQEIIDDEQLTTGLSASMVIIKDADFRSPRILVEIYNKYGEPVFVNLISLLSMACRERGHVRPRLKRTAARIEYLRAMARFVSEFMFNENDRGQKLTHRYMVGQLMKTGNDPDTLFSQAATDADRDQRQRSIDRYLYELLCHRFHVGPSMRRAA